MKLKDLKPENRAALLIALKSYAREQTKQSAQEPARKRLKGAA
jgi:hypothetical protein